MASLLMRTTRTGLLLAMTRGERVLGKSLVHTNEERAEGLGLSKTPLSDSPYTIVITLPI